jgi:hypothetical protein
MLLCAGTASLARLKPIREKRNAGNDVHDAKDQHASKLEGSP